MCWRISTKVMLQVPFKWYSRKVVSARSLLHWVPPHNSYLEPFCSFATMLFAKSNGCVETINDVYWGVANFFRTLRDNWDGLRHLVENTVYSSELYDNCRDTWQNEPDSVRKAWKWWYATFVGAADGAKLAHSSLLGDTSGHNIDKLLMVRDRLRDVQVESADFEVIMRKYCVSETFCYCEPPCIFEAGNVQCVDGMYSMTLEDHERFVSAAMELSGNVMILGYPHPIYDALTRAGWWREELKGTCVGGGQYTGVVWMNYEPPLEFGSEAKSWEESYKLPLY